MIRDEFIKIIKSIDCFAQRFINKCEHKNYGSHITDRYRAFFSRNDHESYMKLDIGLVV